VAFVVPELALVKDREGKIVDVEISYPMGLAIQQLKWAGKKHINTRIFFAFRINRLFLHHPLYLFSRMKESSANLALS
jgi:hypothetical protein